MDPRLRPVAAFTFGYLAIALVAGLRAGNAEFMFYIGVMLVLMGLVWAVNRSIGISTGALWALSLWGLAHMAGAGRAASWLGLPFPVRGPRVTPLVRHLPMPFLDLAEQAACLTLVRILDREQALRCPHLVIEQQSPEVAESGEDEGERLSQPPLALQPADEVGEQHELEADPLLRGRFGARLILAAVGVVHKRRPHNPRARRPETTGSRASVSPI
jgi:hypothetical protein